MNFSNEVWPWDDIMYNLLEDCVQEVWPWDDIMYNSSEDCVQQVWPWDDMYNLLKDCVHFFVSFTHKFI